MPSPNVELQAILLLTDWVSYNPRRLANPGLPANRHSIPIPIILGKEEQELRLDGSYSPRM